MKFIKVMIMVMAALVFASPGMQAADANTSTTVKLSSLPKDARNAITEHAHGRKIEKIERETSQDGKTVYNVCLKGKRDRQEKFKVGADGKVMESDQAESKDQTDHKNQM